MLGQVPKLPYGLTSGIRGAGIKHRPQRALTIGWDFLAPEQVQELLRHAVELTV